VHDSATQDYCVNLEHPTDCRQPYTKLAEFACWLLSSTFTVAVYPFL